MEKIHGMLTVVYATEEFLSVCLPLNLQNFCFANEEEALGV